MKKGWKKVVSVLLGVSLLGAVAGCGNQEEKPPVKPEPTQFDRLNEIKIMDNHEKVNFGSTFDLNTKVAYRNTAFKLPPQFNHYMVLQANAVNCFYGEYDTDGGIAVRIKDEKKIPTSAQNITAKWKTARSSCMPTPFLTARITPYRSIRRADILRLPTWRSAKCF